MHFPDNYYVGKHVQFFESTSLDFNRYFGRYIFVTVGPGNTRRDRAFSAYSFTP